MNTPIFYYFYTVHTKRNEIMAFVCCSIINIMITTSLNKKETSTSFNNVNLPSNIKSITYEEYEHYLLKNNCLNLKNNIN